MKPIDGRIDSSSFFFVQAAVNDILCNSNTQSKAKQWRGERSEKSNTRIANGFYFLEFESSKKRNLHKKKNTHSSYKSKKKKSSDVADKMRN